MPARSLGRASSRAAPSGTSRHSPRNGSTRKLPMTGPLAIDLRDIVKRFPGVVANDGVNLSVRPGTIHAIDGENGAGQYILLKKLHGCHPPDDRPIVGEGSERHFRSPKDAIAAGI